MQRIGYARISTTEQSLDLQIDALKRAGCTQIFTDEGLSGADFQRPGLKAIQKALTPGSMLIVWRLDRLGRSLVDLVSTINKLAERNIEFQSLTEAIDTSTSTGRLLFHIVGSMAEFERALISERTKAGMAAAKARGAKIGRRRSMSCEQIEHAKQQIEAHQA
ncbi:recombinase family protein, partial [Paraburkholderia aspalathi]|nr:recombinase family protein [Paraburkholderia aspalathi]